ncbi:glycosyltransferase family 9 protein [Zeaxanthinibacter sp. PT1]|uniref:glycosyltransferase family 9 protein n=1 Tax=Zeaxanthinibacter TaxID=561554 RepID=UPI00234B03BA|nr:glycosyltransferase family 9 protein [Zeaxanthinibacter sp. PT1]MDC6350591.1 glycosyltransferase family 9 protein [Zeaxanthinibacter sp. PT1]
MGKNKEKPIVILRLSAMGDVAMTIPVILAFRKKYPDIPLTFVTRPFFGKIIRQVPGVQVFTADLQGKHRGILGIWRLARDISRLNPMAVADLHGVLRTHLLRLFTLFNAFPFRQIDKGRPGKKAITATIKKDFSPLKTTFERYTEVFEKLGFPLELRNTDVLKRQPLPAGLNNLIGSDKRKWIGVAPFAAYPGKQYPLDKMEEVVAQLTKGEKYSIFLFGGGEQEGQLLSQWEMKYEHCTNLVGKGSFEEELALISCLDMMLAMDSGNAHLAAMYGIPTLTLWGVTHPYTGFYPFGQDAEYSLLADRSQYPGIPTSVYGNKVPEGYENAMNTISPAAVLEKIKEITAG